MNSPLKLLLEAINQVESEQVLRSHIVPQIGEHFDATRRGIFFFDQLPLADRQLQNILNIALSIEHNPVARYLVEHHAPVHEALVTSPKAWKLICPRPDHWHVMVGPIIDRNQLVGVVGCTREKSMPAFETHNLADLSAICLHLSVWAATVRSGSAAERTLQQHPFRTERLTPRELQIAELVALGRTNAEIGTQLWITENSVKQALKRMFRKLEVSSRTEMVVQLSTSTKIYSFNREG
ncbi:LuxR C-terminal-related transcriptional regulator [Allocoleopsis sp.]|uniref:LuxR C-terminal-related transcriptional regulator n=1 Tax=Allocoleopsis sp. TaxID=3088169 RepID=UPI002FD55A11